MRVTLLIVNYNGGKSIVDSMRRIAAEARSTGGEVIVFDNASTDGSGALLAESGLPLRVVQSNENLGYAAGMNGAAAIARGDTLVLLNPDVTLRPGALETLVTAVENDPKGALFGGVLLRRDGGVDPNCHRALPTLADIRREAWFRPPKDLVENEAALHDRARSPIPVPAISGAAMAIGREAWNTLGPLDAGFFLYHEDSEWCRRAHEKGMTVAVVPGALFEHTGGESTGQNEGPAFEARLLSDFRYYGILGGESPAHLTRLWRSRLATQHHLARLRSLAGTHAARRRWRRRASIYWLLRDALTRETPDSIARGTNGTRPGTLVDWPPARSTAPAHTGKPRVAHIIPDMNIGGAQKLVQKVVLETRSDFEHLVICLKPEMALLDSLRGPGIHVHAIGMTDWKEPRSWMRAKHYLSLVDADLYHSHLIPADLAMRFAPRGKRPWISTKHSVDIRFGAPTRMLERWALAPSDAVYAVSMTVARAKSHLAKSGSLPVVIPNPPTVPIAGTSAGTGADIDDPPPPPFSREKVRVLSIGRLHPVKKTERFLETAKILRDRDPDRYEFRVVGSGQEEEMLRARAAALGIEDVLTFHPFTADVAAAIDQADCVLFFSKGEGLGIVILDTIARSRVPIVRRAAGAAEALPAALDDCFVDSDSPAEFADRVERFMRDPASIRERVSAAADAMRDRWEYAHILADQYRKWTGSPGDDEASAAPERRTRVLHIITRMIVGGAQENTLASVAYVNRMRFDSDLWTGPQTGTEGDLRGRAERIGVLPVYFPNVVRELNPLRDMIATWQLYRMLRKRRYDIVHTHSSKIGIIGRLAARAAGVPHIVHTAHGWGFHEHMAGWLRGIYVTLEKLVLPMTDRLVSVSEETTRVGLAAGIGRPEDYALIRSGIPTNEFFADEARGAEVRAALDIARDRIVIGTIGRLSPQKNPLDFVRVAAVICAKHERAHFVSVGEGPLRSEVEAAIRDAGLEDRITLLGLRGDVPDLMRAMDLYIMTSLWEGLPRVVVQALATGVPVISYDVAGTKEIVREGKNGFLVPAGEWQMLADRIDTILSDEATAKELGRVCANEFDASFTEEKMVRDLENLYAGLMRKKWW